VEREGDKAGDSEKLQNCGKTGVEIKLSSSKLSLIGKKNLGESAKGWRDHKVVHGERPRKVNLREGG